MRSPSASAPSSPCSPPHSPHSPRRARMHYRRRRAPLFLLGVAAFFLLLQLPRLGSAARLAAMRLAALRVATHPSAPLPEVVPGLLAASWARPREDDVALFMRLHVFSADSADGRARRVAIRAHSPASWVKGVEMRFVVPDAALAERNVSSGNGTQADEGERIRGPRRLDARQERPRSVEAEAEEFGDILRVPGHDVAAEWLRAVGRGDAARWIVKCDDSTLPLLPNMVADLRKRDWRTPTYFGTTSGRELDRPFFYRGMLYGFSWPVVATVASADIATGTGVSDAERTGQLMWSLPSTSGMPRLLRGYPCLRTRCPASFQEDTMRPALFERLRTAPDYPRRDDPRTGLRFVNYLGRIEGPAPWIRNDARTALAYYGLSAEEYTRRFLALDAGMRRRGGV